MTISILQFVCGFIGAFATEVLFWYERWRGKGMKKRPLDAGRWYWISGLTMWIFGGFLAVLYSPDDMTKATAIMNLHIGASTPLIISRWKSRMKID